MAHTITSITNFIIEVYISKKDMDNILHHFHILSFYWLWIFSMFERLTSLHHYSFIICLCEYKNSGIIGYKTLGLSKAKNIFRKIDM